VHVERIDHVGVLVKDLNKAMKFFHDVFGMDFVKPFETPEGDILETMDATGFDLTAPLTPDGLTAKIIERKGEGLNVICFKVLNLDEAIADAKSHGLKVIMGGVQREAKWACFHPRDTFGVMIEIIEYKARCQVLSGFTPPIWEKAEL